MTPHHLITSYLPQTAIIHNLALLSTVSYEQAVFTYTKMVNVSKHTSPAEITTCAPFENRCYSPNYEPSDTAVLVLNAVSLLPFTESHKYVTLL